jgi:biopolymer transport protein TolR
MAEPQDAPLSAAQRSRIRRLSQPKEPDAGEEAGELNVVPYLDIITNVMMFVLASVSVTFVTSIDTTPPSIGGSNKVRSEISSKALNLSAFITGQGVVLKTSGGNIAPGCGTGAGATIGAGVTVPKKGDEYDLVSLTACAKQIKNVSPDYQEEMQVTITANPGIDYKTVINVMDSLRKSGDQDLFPEAHFGVAR